MRRRLLPAIAIPLAGAAILALVLTAGFGPSGDARSGASHPPTPGHVAQGPSDAPGPTQPPTTPSPPPATPRPRPSPTPNSLATAGVPAALQGALDEMRVAAGIPGISASIVLPDGTTWTGVSGEAVVADHTLVVPETAFAAASISKTFVAALILDLSAEGRFGLNDLVATYLPEFGIAKSITIHQLLDHTSGLADYFLDPKIDRALLADPDRHWTADDALGYVGKAYFPPGTGWHYSNTNYLLLGLLAERVAGQPLAEQLRVRYFDPLGLETAYTQVDESPHGPVAHGYRFAGPGLGRPPIDLADGTGVVPFRSVVTAADGAGSVASSSLDLARWGQALYNDRATQPGTAALMLADVDVVAGYKPRVPYGLGVQVVAIGDRFVAWGHSGRFLGFRSALRYLPEEGVAIAVMTNQSRADPGPIVARLLDILLPPPPPCGLCRTPV